LIAHGPDCGAASKVTTMPFSNHDIRSAYCAVCETLLPDGDVDDSVTEFIANKIVDLAKTGEHRADRLAELVLSDLADATQADSALINPSQRGRDLLIPDFVHRNIFTIFVQYNPL
jgi:hypothetical protein